MLSAVDRKIFSQGGDIILIYGGMEPERLIAAPISERGTADAGKQLAAGR